MIQGSIEAHIDAIHRRGLLVNNLFEHNDGRWQANVRTKSLDDHGKGQQFGYGSTPEEALLEALKAAVRDGLDEQPTPKPVRRPIIVVKKKV